MTDWGNRISARRRELGMTQVDLATLCNIQPPSVNDWESGKTRSLKGTSLIAAARALRVDPEWITTGHPESAVKNAVAGPAIRGRVPLISWVQAGEWSQVEDPYAAGEAAQWLACPNGHGPRTYCLLVRGQSMLNPAGRHSYAEGDVIFVDPDKPAVSGSRVIVRLDDRQDATFKQLIIEDGRQYLKALNPAWPESIIEVSENATVCGVVIGKWVPE